MNEEHARNNLLVEVYKLSLAAIAGSFIGIVVYQHQIDAHKPEMFTQEQLNAAIAEAIQKDRKTLWGMQYNKDVVKCIIENLEEVKS